MAVDVTATNTGFVGAPGDVSAIVAQSASPEPAVFSAVEAGENRVRLSWSPATSPSGTRTGCEVQVSVAGGAWSPIARTVPLEADATGVTVNHLANGVVHRFRVVAAFSSGETAISSESSPSIPQAPAVSAGRFPAPTNVSASAGNQSVTVRWSAVAGAIDGYTIEYSVDGGWSWVTGGQAAKAATSLVVGGLANGVPCQIRVAARDAAGTGAFSKPTPASNAVPGTEGAETYADIGVSSLQFTADGRLAELVRESVAAPDGNGTTSRLVFRVAGTVRDMAEDVILEEQLGPTSQLVFTPDGKANVLVAGSTLRHFRLDAGGWRLVSEEPLELPSAPSLLVARTASDGSFHFVVGAPGFFRQPGSLHYGTNAGGSWRVERITDRAEVQGYSYAGIGRHVGLALSGDGKAHVVYTPEVEIRNRPDGFTPFYSELAYATNQSGGWTTEIVHRPPDGTGESGGGASIAISPSGQPYIAQFFLDSAPTGSAISARLQVQQRKPGGGWTMETVVSSPDGYALKDGPKFTGYAPLVAFDGAGVPHIAFSDLAARHNPSQEQYVGQIRHAWKANGRWQVETIYRQTDPLQNTMGLPSMAVGTDSIVFSGIEFRGEATSLVKISRPLASGGGGGGGGAKPGDTTAPTVRSVKPPAFKTYAAGGQLGFTVTFSENVKVTGVPALPVQIGNSMRLATYVKGSGTKSLVFAALVQSGDLDTDGVTVGAAIVQDAGTISDAAGNASLGTLPAVNASRVFVDAVGPQIVAVGSLPSGSFKVGQKLALAVTFSEPVVVKGKPTITISIGQVARTMTYVSGTNTATLTFSLTVKKGDPLSGAFAIQNLLNIPSNASIKDRAGNGLVSSTLPVAVG